MQMNRRQRKYIRNNYLGKSDTDIAKHLRIKEDDVKTYRTEKKLFTPDEIARFRKGRLGAIGICLGVAVDLILETQGMGLVSLIMSGGKSDNSSSKSNYRPASPEEALNQYIQSLKIPSKKFELRDVELNSVNPKFESVDDFITSYMPKYKHFDNAWFMGTPDLASDVLRKIYSDLKKMDLIKGEGEVTPKNIFSLLHNAYLQNNIWIGIQTFNTDTDAPFRTLIKLPIVRKQSVTFSYFGGEISGENVPVYYINNSVKDYNMGHGCSTKHGLFIFEKDVRGKVKNAGKDLKKAFDDMIIHESVHYSSRIFLDEFDIGRQINPRSQEEDILLAEDELRAFLTQAIFGHYPRLVYSSLLGSDNVPHYKYAQEILRTSLVKKLSQFRTQSNPEIPLTSKLLRSVAHATYLEEFQKKK